MIIKGQQERLEDEGYAYGLDGGDGFAVMFLFPNLSSCIYWICTDFYSGSYLNKMFNNNNKA